MKNIFIKLLISPLSIIFFGFCFSSELHAKKGYQQKSICQGYGKRSSVNGRIKTAKTSGYWKGSPSKGYKYVNSYSRSKRSK